MGDHTPVPYQTQKKATFQPKNRDHPRCGVLHQSLEIPHSLSSGELGWRSMVPQAGECMERASSLAPMLFLEQRCSYAAVTNPSVCTRQDDQLSAQRAPSELLSALDSICLYRIEDWWTYELCYKKHVRQFHKVQHSILSSTWHLPCAGLWKTLPLDMYCRGCPHMGIIERQYCRGCCGQQG